ncbi:DSD1 family PLP-dependent enzyme [Variovorax sp. V512]
MPSRYKVKASMKQQTSFFIDNVIADADRPWNIPPAVPGMPIAEVDTPALILDLDALEFNMNKVHERLHAAGLRVRPHGKAHKSADIARLQIASGAIGICCQKISEAEAFVAGGVADVLVTNQIVGAIKTRRAAQLARRCALSVCVDHQVQIDQLAEATRDAASRIGVLVEVDIGHGRCGVSSVNAVVELAKLITRHSPQLSFAGLHAFRGSAQHLRTYEEREAAVDQAVAMLRDVVEALSREGLECPTITGGGTGTYALEAASGLYTEVQPGSYVLMDADYAENIQGENDDVLRHALFVMCSVISAQSHHAVLDGGLKAFAMDRGVPKMVDCDSTVRSVSDEHAVIEPGESRQLPRIGEKVRLIPGHCDPTVNLHDWIVAFRGSHVSHVWPVTARGAMF